MTRTQGYIPKFTINAFNILSQKSNDSHITSSVPGLSSVVDMSRENGTKVMFCPCLFEQPINLFCYPSSRRRIHDWGGQQKSPGKYALQINEKKSKRKKLTLIASLQLFPPASI
jgi:hypothetical protein